jgi:GNAT superfamily N-acetyltransferase
LGLASRLIERALEYMKQNGITISSLHTSTAAPLYEKFGWARIERSFVQRPWKPIDGNKRLNFQLDFFFFWFENLSKIQSLYLFV